MSSGVRRAHVCFCVRLLQHVSRVCARQGRCHGLQLGYVRLRGICAVCTAWALCLHARRERERKACEPDCLKRVLCLALLPPVDRF